MRGRICVAVANIANIGAMLNGFTSAFRLLVAILSAALIICGLILKSGVYSLIGSIVSVILLGFDLISAYFQSRQYRDGVWNDESSSSVVARVTYWIQSLIAIGCLVMACVDRATATTNGE